MTDLSYLDPSPGARTTRRVPSIAAPSIAHTWIVALYAAATFAGGAGLAVAFTAPPTGRFEWQLALLLRFMAVVKGAMVLGALGLAHWRLRRPIGERMGAGFIAAIALMMIAPGLIWSLHHIALGAAFFHAGLLVFLVLAWRDDAAGRFLPRSRAPTPRRT